MSTPEGATSLKKRGAQLLIGHSARFLDGWVFDQFIYGTVITWATLTYGSLGGAAIAFLILTPASAAICEFYLVGYDALKTDWLGLEVLKSVREKEATSHGFFGFLRRQGKKMLQWDTAALVFFSITTDPFVTTAYLRRGANTYNGLSTRDWRFFWSSVLISNIYWTFRWTVVIELAQMLFTKLPTSWQEFILVQWQQLTSLF